LLRFILGYIKFNEDEPLSRDRFDYLSFDPDPLLSDENFAAFDYLMRLDKPEEHPELCYFLSFLR
jgi:hypothetical protein